MRLRGWEIDNFGVLSDFVTRDLPDGITVFQGPNESGKSTLLGYLRSMVFGTAGLRGKRRQRNLYPALKEGTHGGRLFVESPDGIYILERNLSKPFRFELIRPDGTEGTREEWQQILGTVDHNVYEAVFAFNLEELAVLKTLTTSGVGDRIFSASLGRTGRAARALLEKLEREANELHGIENSDSEIQRLAQEMESLAAEYKQAREAAASYPKLLATERENQQKIQELEKERDEQLAIEKRSRHLIDFWIDWEPCLKIKEELDAMKPVDDFVESPEERLQETVGAIDNARTEQERLEGELEIANMEWDSLASQKSDSLLAVAGEAKGLTGFAQYQERCRIHASATNQNYNMQEGLNRFFKRIGPDWDAAGLSAFDTSDEMRAEVDSWQTRIDTVEADLFQAEESAAQCRKVSKKAQADQKAAYDAMREALDERGQKLSHYEERLKNLDRLLKKHVVASESISENEVRLQVHQNRLDNAWDSLDPCPSRWSAPVFFTASIGILELAIWEMSTGSFMFGGIVLGCSALIAAGALQVNVLRKRFAQQSRKIENIEHSLRNAWEAQQEARAKLSMLRDYCKAQLIRLTSETAPDAEGLDARADELRNCQKRLQAVLNDEQQANDLVESSRKTRSMIQERWDDWVEEHGFEAPLTPAEVLGIFDGIEEARKTLDAVEEQERFLADLEERMESWARPARALLERCDRLPEAEICGEDLVRAFEEMLGACQEEMLRRERMAELEPRLMSLREEREKAGFALVESEEALQALFVEAEVEDETAYLSKMGIYLARLDLKAELREVEDKIARHLGEDANMEEFLAELGKGETEAWQETADQARVACDEIQARRDEAVGDLREAELARQALETSVEVQDLGLKLECAKTELARKVHEWRVLVVERHLVEETLHAYLEGRQPEVLRAAGEFFEEATRGKYGRVVLKEDGKSLAVRDADGNEKRPDQLSLGTAELLYLCIRLGLITAFNKDHAGLPVIMDDVLVNFDPERARDVAKLLAKVAEQSQILFFTCHPFTVELLEAACTDVRVEHMQRIRAQDADLEQNPDLEQDTDSDQDSASEEIVEENPIVDADLEDDDDLPLELDFEDEVPVQVTSGEDGDDSPDPLDEEPQ